METFTMRIDMDDLRQKVQAIREEIGKVVVGQHDMIELLIVGLLADGHVLIEGVPGVAKTLTAKVLAQIFDVQFSRIQFTPDLMPSDVLGTSVFNLKTSEFEFRKGAVFTNLLLIDEINRAPAKTQSALFEVMEERQVTIDGHTYPFAPPFMVVATQNPVEQEGTYRLPEAQLDRFLFKIEVNYPSLDEEVELLGNFHGRRSLLEKQTIQPLLKADEIALYRQKTAEIHVETNLLRYIAEIVQKTRNSGAVYLGASPRASIAILNASKAFSAIQGRDFVTPEDIKAMALPVMRHRIILTAEKEMEGSKADEVLKQIVESVEIPR